jgi:hypothetical protein
MDRDRPSTSLTANLRVDSGEAKPMPADSLRTRWSRLIASHFAFRSVRLTIIIMMIAFSVAPIVNVIKREIFNKDYDLWQATGQIVLDGKDIYPRTPGPYPFMYPPSCAWMFAPISVLPRGLFVGCLLLLNSAAWASCIFASVYLATGKIRGVHPALYFWPSLAVIPFVHDTYLLGQPALLLLGLLLWSFAFLRKKMPVTAGALIAVAAAIKAYPILAAGYLVYRKQWKALIAMGVTLCALMFVVPLVFRSPVQVKDDFVLWAKGMLFKYDENSIGQRPDRAYSYKNQSVQATVHRLSRSVLADGEADRFWKVNLLNLSFRQTTILMLAVTGGLALLYVGCSWGATKWPLPADAVEQSMGIIMVLFLTPLSFNYGYVWLMFPITVLLHLGFSAAPQSKLRLISWGSIAASIVLLSFSVSNLRVAQAYANVFFSGLILMCSLGFILRSGLLKQATGTAITSSIHQHAAADETVVTS